jgi:hypothetical protein
METLKSTVEACKAVQTFREEGEMHYGVAEPGREGEGGWRYRVAFQAPNLFRVERDASPDICAAFKAVCDGQTLYAEGEVNGRLTAAKGPAPRDLTDPDLLALLRPALRFFMTDNLQVPDFLNCRSGGFDLAALKSAREGLDARSKFLASQEDPPRTRVLTLQPRWGPPLTVWINKRAGLLVKYAFAATNAQLVQVVVMKDIKVFANPGDVRVVVTARRQDLDEPMPPETFTYTPPEGAQVVAAKSVRDLCRAFSSDEEITPKE